MSIQELSIYEQEIMRLKKQNEELITTFRHLLNGIDERDKRTGLYTFGTQQARAIIEKAEKEN